MNNLEQTKTAPERKVLSLKLFRELIEKQSSAEQIKKQLSEFGEEYEAPLPETLKKEDKEKLKTYSELNLKELPED